MRWWRWPWRPGGGQQAGTSIFPSIDTLGAGFPPYVRIGPGACPFLDADHAAIARLPVVGGLIDAGVPGFLRPADALALYEIAHQAEGDVIEMGSAWGLSTSIIARAIAASGRAAAVWSIEIEPGFQAATRATIAAAGLSDRFRGIAGDARVVAPALAREGLRFGAAFVDHDHSQAATRDALASLARLLRPGALALMHDFNDARNRTEPAEYGVYQGVAAAIAAGGFDYVDTIGCCALIRKAL